MDGKEQQPNLTVIPGGLSEKVPTNKTQPGNEVKYQQPSNITSQTGIPEGQLGPILEKQDFVSRARRTLSDLFKKPDTKSNNTPPQEKAL